MHVIKKDRFVEAAKKYPNQREAIMDLYRALKRGKYDTPDEMRQDFPSLDNIKYKEGWWVIDINGNTLRAIAFIRFSIKKFFIKYIVTHSEYDRIIKLLRKGRL